MRKLTLSLFASTIFINIGLGNIQLASAHHHHNSQINIQSQNTQKTSPEIKNNKQNKPRIAVLDFDYSSVASNWGWWWRSSGKGVSDILVNKLVETGNFRVIERSKLEAVLAEQNLGASGRVDTGTAAKIGKILGVETIVIGSVTESNIERGSGGVRVPLLGRVGGGKTTANVRLNLRVVDTSTAEILLTAEGQGNSSNTGGSINIRGYGVDTSSRKEAKLITNATVEAIDKAVQKISSNSSRLATNSNAAPSQNAIVADVSGKTVILNKGTGNGYRPGIRLSIERVTREVKDPTTGKVIRKITQPVGMIEVTEADAQSSVAKIVSGTGLKVGDVAKPVK